MAEGKWNGKRSGVPASWNTHPARSQLLAGLAALPIVLATGGEPPETWPESRWQPFDRMGYAAYRITLMVLASGVIVGLFAALRSFIGEEWALIGAGLLALSPFGVHEVMFTWPKWAAITGVLASFMRAHARHGFVAGIALAIGFFHHPIALLSAPWIALYVLRFRGGTRCRLVLDSGYGR
jgi:hypothetical protein